MTVQRFGPYELIRRLGSGGMAETYLAVRRGPGGFEQHVCVKRILPFYERDPGFVKDFLEEARLAAQLRHANITQVVDFGEVDGSHYLALELIDGLDLRSVLRRLAERGARLDPSLVVLLGIELATALDFAHTPSSGRDAVVHRDVSPSNVLVSRSGGVYLTDFGIARAVGAKRVTDSGVVRGKVPYMAPEYALHRRFDARTDLFGLGVVLFEALAGQRPFDGTTDLDTLQRIESGAHAPLAALAPQAPAPLVQAVEALIRADPGSRYQSASHLVEALAPMSPPATSRRDLGQLVASLGDSLEDSLALSGSARTLAIGEVAAPAYPSVAHAEPDAQTRTSDAGPKPARTPEPGWSVTDPTRVSHHDRPSPYSATTPMGQAVIPVTQPTLPASLPPPPPVAARPRRAGLLALIVVLGIVTFIAATAGTYALVVALQSGAL
ncbi:MAG: serine/threonine protein kinase [Sandaracinaceae bacterium]|nr:serine/threonine protein kinase [Sandaracinaceae bacterium]